MRRSSWVLAVAVIIFGAFPGAPGAPAAAAISATKGAGSPGGPAQLGTTAATTDTPTTPPIDAHDALVHVTRLASPEMEGRGVLTPGLDRAGAYIAERFRGMGLLAAGDGGSFFQAVDIPLPRRPSPRSALSLAGRALVMGRDFAPNFGSAATRALGGLVFAGYGISIAAAPAGVAGAVAYDDYAGIDARGKLVICLRHAPHYDVKAGKAADPAFDAGAALRAKAENAIRHGAIGIAIVDPPADPTQDPVQGPIQDPIQDPLQNSLLSSWSSDDVAPLPAFGMPGVGGIASFHLAPAVADGLLRAAGVGALGSLRRLIDESGQPASRGVAGSAAFAVVWDSPSVLGRNVVAVLPGSDPVLRDEAVLIGAHYDHLGRGDEGSVFDRHAGVHPGADDNASGTAAVLEVAEALAAAPARPRRSIMFVAFTGEEKGLIGSLALAEQAKGRHVVAMLNLDMVGRMHDNAIEVGGGTTAGEWEAIVNDANLEKLTLTFPRRVVPNSDHASFLNKQIPSLFLFTGLHADYHRASDTPDKVNAEGIAKTARLALRVVVAVADRAPHLTFVVPEWTRTGAVGGAHGTTVRLGVMPDYQSSNGLRLSAVLAGGAGADAGLRTGDVIEGIGDKRVADIESYMDALALFKGGDTTVIKIRRSGTARALTVKFGPIDADLAAPAPAAPTAPAPGGVARP